MTDSFLSDQICIGDWCSSGQARLLGLIGGAGIWYVLRTLSNSENEAVAEVARVIDTGFTWVAGAFVVGMILGWWRI